MKVEDVCEVQCIHEEEVNAAKESMLSEKDAVDVATFFKHLGDPTRLKIVTALYKGELCVCDIACVVGMTQSATSHQLRVLTTARLTKRRKEGKIVYYSLNDHHVITILQQAMEHVTSEQN